MEPAKWKEPNFGDEGGGFWIVAICGTKVIWNNDIEDGLMETFKVEGFPLFMTAVRFRLLYDYIEQKIRKDIKYFIKDLKDKRDIRKIES